MSLTHIFWVPSFNTKKIRNKFSFSFNWFFLFSIFFYFLTNFQKYLYLIGKNCKFCKKIFIFGRVSESNRENLSKVLSQNYFQKNAFSAKR